MDDPTPKRRTAHVQSVSRALSLIELLARQKAEMSLTEIASEMRWPKSTAHGLLTTLREYQYVDQNPDSGRYRLGVRLFELGNLVARTWDIRAIAYGPMRRLNERFGEMVQLATENNGEVLYLEKVESTQLIRIVSEVGARLPMHCSALGKVLLAHRTASEWKRILRQRGMAAMTSRTITSIEQMEHELAGIRSRGYALDDGEIMDSLRCVAAAIRAQDGAVRYAISVSGLASNMRGERLDAIVGALRATAREISASVGFRAEE